MIRLTKKSMYDHDVRLALFQYIVIYTAAGTNLLSPHLNSDRLLADAQYKVQYHVQAPHKAQTNSLQLLSRLSEDQLAQYFPSNHEDHVGVHEVTQRKGNQKASLEVPSDITFVSKSKQLHNIIM